MTKPKIKRPSQQLPVIREAHRLGLLESEIDALSALRGRLKMVAHFIYEHPGLNQTEGANTLGVSRPYFRTTIKTLNELGFTREIVDGVSLRIYPSDLLKKVYELNL